MLLYLFLFDNPKHTYFCIILTLSLYTNWSGMEDRLILPMEYKVALVIPQNGFYYYCVGISSLSIPFWPIYIPSYSPNNMIYAINTYTYPFKL